MANIFIQKYGAKNINGKQKLTFYCHDATATAALPTTSTAVMYDGKLCPVPDVGSTAVQIDTGDIYKLDYDYAWVKQPDTAADVQAVRDYMTADAPCVLTVGSGTTVSLYSSLGVPFLSAQALMTGDPVFKFDVLLMTGETSVSGATNVAALGAHYYRVDGGLAVVVA